MTDPDQAQRVSKRSIHRSSDLMVRMIEGCWLAKAIDVVVRLQIPDLLSNGPKDCRELSEAAGTHADNLYRLLRALAAEGIFSVDAEERFSLTPTGTTLQSAVPGSLRDWALLMLGDVNQGAWNELFQSVRTGEGAFGRKYEQDLWRYRAEHSQYSELFDRAMASFTMTYVDNVLASYSFSRFRKIVDVGGGNGKLLTAILRANPEARGVVYDLPHVAQSARQSIDAAGLSGRCEVIGGDALAEVPPGADAYILSRVLHDWDDESAVKILVNCRKAFADSGHVLVIERAMPDRVEVNSDGDPIVSDIYLTDLNMMVMTSGRERTLKEYRDLCGRTGLKLVNVVSTRTAMNVMEVVDAVSGA